ncbi:hypothetical protein AJ80_00911 [Polytolypa hystricis UAMH7299]|uniref:Fe2OG dioxygenase domain-containing protein n=1 Tax=Polytolypa hystricis (strain UAMH7299) TaxID=1447883 RepID=A0A2B7Z2I3_POLH7|nr:hypothetical protein AJ80_00911 [Polytolypa hystricis UAMH7299]
MSNATSNNMSSEKAADQGHNIQDSSPFTPSAHRRSRKKYVPSAPLGPNDAIGEGDSRIIYDLNLPSDAFELIRDEVKWQKMYHLSGEVPRLVAVQGAVQPDNSIPIYRHPADESPPLLSFTKTVDVLREAVEKILGHPLNHVLIQLYRDGQDRISEHSDKTLDIVRGSYICNVSLGAERVMTLRTKVSAKAEKQADSNVAKDSDPERQSQRVPLPHNSLFILGENTNKVWLHGIRPDKRPESTKTPEELAFNGQRISLTFRNIGTFINPEADTIWGQGAVSKTKENAQEVIHGECVETEGMIRAFGQENQRNDFNWDANYGRGFNVVNFVTKASPKLSPSEDQQSS